MLQESWKKRQKALQIKFVAGFALMHPSLICGDAEEKRGCQQQLYQSQDQRSWSWCWWWNWTPREGKAGGSQGPSERFASKSCSSCILYYIVLYCIVLCYILYIIYYIIFYDIILYYIILILYYIVCHVLFFVTFCTSHTATFVDTNIEVLMGEVALTVACFPFCWICWLLRQVFCQFHGFGGVDRCILYLLGHWRTSCKGGEGRHCSDTFRHLLGFVHHWVGHGFSGFWMESFQGLGGVWATI